MLSDFLPLLVLACCAVGILAAMLIVGHVLGPRRGTRPKLVPYESGMWPIGDARRRFAVKYYVVAMLFILFDIEAIFLYPWAVRFHQLGLFGLIEMAIFLAILGIAYVYVWLGGGFEWD